MRKLLFIFGLGSLGIGAYIYYKRQLEMLKNISYKVVGVDILEYTPLTLQVSTELTNNSEVAFTIKGYDIDVIVNGIKVARVKNASLNEELRGFGATSTINFITSLSIKESGSSLGQILGGVFDGQMADTSIVFKGVVGVKRGIFEFSNYPVDLEWKLGDFL